MQGATGEVTAKLKDTTANPAPLGLLGFGITTVLLNIHNAGYLGAPGRTILAMGIFYGGIAQIIAGLMEYRKGNTFGTTAFTSYGLFWLSFATILIVPNLGWYPAPDKANIAVYLLMWGIFTFVMFIGTLRLNRALQFVFLTLAILFFLLAAGDAFGNTTITNIAGYEGLVCGLSAIYTGLAQVLNEVYGRTVAPLFPVKPKQPQPAPAHPIYMPPQQQTPPPPGAPPQG